MAFSTVSTVSLRHYYLLTKPGIIYGNLLPAIAGYLLASGISQQFSLIHFFITLFGLAMIIASACVANNIIDRPIDVSMKRTKMRATVTGAIPIKNALLFSITLCFIGTTALYCLPTLLPLLIALTGHILYVVVYGYAKRHTVHSTEIGALSGAIPPLVGYTAVLPAIDSPALSLFLILCAWQMVHFYAIAIYRQKEYEHAKIYLFPSRYGVRATKIAVMSYLVLLLFIVLLPHLFGTTGIAYVALVASWTIYWIYKSIQKFSSSDINWSRWMFRQSLIGLLIYSIALSIGALLP